MFVGSQHVEAPYTSIGVYITIFYFGYFLILIPVIGVLENTIYDIYYLVFYILYSDTHPFRPFYLYYLIILYILCCIKQIIQLLSTPVSSLLHAATLVIAGIYLIIRSSYIFEFSTTCYIYIGFCGGNTCLIGSVVGMYQNDMKRTTYSTISQMGYLYLIVSLSVYNVCIYHIINQEFFQALLFKFYGYLFILIMIIRTLDSLYLWSILVL